MHRKPRTLYMHYGVRIGPCIVLRGSLLRRGIVSAHPLTIQVAPYSTYKEFIMSATASETQIEKTRYTHLAA